MGHSVGNMEGRNGRQNSWLTTFQKGLRAILGIHLQANLGASCLHPQNLSKIKFKYNELSKLFGGEHFKIQCTVSCAVVTVYCSDSDL